MIISQSFLSLEYNPKTLGVFTYLYLILAKKAIALVIASNASNLYFSRIVLYNLEICSGEQIPNEFLSEKADFILCDKKQKDSLRNYPFNLSDLLALGDIFNKSIKFMISGIE